MIIVHISYNTILSLHNSLVTLNQTKAHKNPIGYIIKFFGEAFRKQSVIITTTLGLPKIYLFC